MKHLKSYKLFESIDYTLEDIRDILLELSDKNFNVRVETNSHHAFSQCIKVTISKDGGNFDFWTERNIGELTPFKFGLVKEYLIRVLSYVSRDRWNAYNFDIVTTEKLHNCLDSGSFNDGTYKTAIKIKDGELVNSHYSFRTSQETVTPIEDDVNVLCVYIGLGK